MATHTAAVMSAGTAVSNRPCGPVLLLWSGDKIKQKALTCAEQKKKRGARTLPAAGMHMVESTDVQSLKCEQVMV
jgi:hypothetical protein